MKRSLVVVCAVLGTVWITSTGTLLFYIANLAPVQALLLAFVAMDAAFVLLLAICLVSNTRPRSAWPDPWSKTTDELLHDAVQLPDGGGYGRRHSDDRGVVARLSEVLEDEAAKRPRGQTPAWVMSINQRHESPAAQFEDVPDADA